MKFCLKFTAISLSFVLFGTGCSSVNFTENLYKLENLPKLRTDTKSKMFSSYDRTGKNNDGFKGTYSKLRIENGNSVIAEMDGPGVITRIWTTHSIYKEDGLLDKKGEHIKIYLDGCEKPQVDVPLVDLFNGKLPQFPKPLVGSKLGGFYCYVPIPYRNGCKVVLEGTAVKFYHLNYLELPTVDRITTFSMKMTKEKKAYLANAVKIWFGPGNLSLFDIKNPNQTKADLNLKANQSYTINLPSGNNMVRAVYLENTKTIPDAQIQFLWDNSDSAAVDLPLEYFYCQALESESIKSLLVGQTDNSYYNFIPMPYRKNATVKITAKKNLQMTLKITTSADSITNDMAYLHAIYHKQIPTKPGVYYRWLKRKGKGHYIGTYLVTSGADNRGKGLPRWLEGDERFMVDGELVIHGTGSEDYFNCGWYGTPNRLTQAGTLPLHGFPVYSQAKDVTHVSAYRWHLNDIVPYQKEILAEIEHGPANQYIADYQNAVYFYDIDPAAIP
ncbi:MAG: glycoside hydrolase family 172 protein [Planctomycetota bacterium]|jgi:hypothetical protein